MASAQRQYRRVVVTIASAVAGAILGAAVDDVLNTELRLAAAAVVALCVAVVAVLTVSSGQIERTVAIQTRTLDAVRDVVKSTRAVSDAMGKRIDDSQREPLRILEDVRRQIGLRVTSQQLRDFNAMTSLVEDPVGRAMREAKDEILVLDLISPTGRRPDLDMRDDMMREHLNRVLDHVREERTSVVYRRICQVANPAEPFVRVTDGAFIEHCREVCRLREQAGRRVAVKVTPARYPYKFVLIDRRTMILQLHEMERLSGEFQFRCELMIDDPQQDLIGVFSNMWNELEDDPATRTVEHIELSGTMIPQDAGNG